jgi:N,N'-diacetylchitobiose transport system substrate-binding protein
MKRRFVLPGLLATLAIVAAVAAGGSSGATSKAADKTLSVWLQIDAQSGWSDLVAATNAKFQSDHPGVNVNVQYQTWPTHLQKFDATLAGGNTPDVIEMGNTEMTKYMAAGAFQDLTAEKASFPNSKTWLAGLAASGQFGGKLYGVPYYAGTRVVTYRTDLFKKAGLRTPTSLDEFIADAKKLIAQNPQKGFSATYVAGEDWYSAMGWVFDYGGGIATQVSGKWKGILDSPKSIAGLTAYRNFFTAASRAGKTAIENTPDPNPYTVYGQGLAASMVGPVWYTCCVGKKYAGTTAQFAMPSHVKGQVMPGFLGGSDLAVPIGADKALAEDWIRDFTSTSAEKTLQAKGNVPNTTSLLNLNKVNERAALKSWFVPQAKNWVNVESQNILRNMLGEILTGRLSVKQAATAASDTVASILNASS